MLNIFVLLIIIFSYFLVGGLFPAKKSPPPTFKYTGGTYLHYPGGEDGGKINPQTNAKSCPYGTTGKEEKLRLGDYDVTMYFCENAGSAPGYTYTGGGWLNYPKGDENKDAGRPNSQTTEKTCPAGTFKEYSESFTCKDTRCEMVLCRIL